MIAQNIMKNANLPFSDRLERGLTTYRSTVGVVGSPLLQRFFPGSKLCCTGTEMGSATRYMLWRNTAGIMTI